MLVENIEGRFHHKFFFLKVVAALYLTILTIFLTTELSKNCEIEAHNCDKVRIDKNKFLLFSRNSDLVFSKLRYINSQLCVLKLELWDIIKCTK